MTSRKHSASQHFSHQLISWLTDLADLLNVSVFNWTLKMRRFLIAGLLLLGLAVTSCIGRNPDVAESGITPVIVTAVSPTTPPTSTATAVPANTIPAPEAATAIPTDIPPTATPVPTNTPIPAEPVTAVSFEPIVTGLFRPTILTHAGDDRLFIGVQTGTIYIYQNGQLLPDPFLDIQNKVNSNANEQGLLGLAFHPQFNNPAHVGYGRFFINYSGSSGETIIARYQVDPNNPNRADASSEVVLLTIPQPYENHNGGHLAFGPDGYLYVGMGDGGSQGDPQGNGQNANSLLGALLRLDVDHEGNGAAYAVPADNPFVASGNGRAEIWAIGLRNPWRFSFDRLTGDLYLADVGQNLYEEVNRVPAGAAGINYGWNIMEGTHCYNADSCSQTGLTLPFFDYDHTQGCSVTGGYVYRGQEYPTWQGNYFFADFCTGVTWAAFPNPDGSWTVNRVREQLENISSFGEDVNGELYVLSFSNGGTVYRLRP